MIWPFNSSGVYFVKSSTKCLEKETNLLAPRSSHAQDNDIWKRIWRLSVPNKVRNFPWHSCHNAIPIKQCLWKRKILSDDICEQCRSSSETIRHTLWGCLKIAEVWEALQGFKFQQLHNFTSFRDLVGFVHMEGKNLELMAMVMWTIWRRRNQFRMSSKDFLVSQVLPQATQAFSDFKSLNVSLPSQPVVTGNSRVQALWSPPPRDCFKINFDEAMFSNLGKAGLGVAVRDCSGSVVASLSEQVPLPFSSDIVEAMTSARAILFAIRSSTLDPSYLRETFFFFF